MPPTTPGDRRAALLADANALKCKGNDLHKQRNQPAAIAEYSKAIILLEKAVSSPSSLDELDTPIKRWFPFFASSSTPPEDASSSSSSSSSTSKRRTMAFSKQPTATASPSLFLRARMSEPVLPRPTNVTKLSFSELLERDRQIVDSTTPTTTPTTDDSMAVELKEEMDLLSSLYSNRALAYTMNRQFDLAWVDANTVIRLRPEWIKGYFRRAEVFLRTERYKDALLDFETALTKEFTNKSIRERIARTKIHIQDQDSGLICHQISVARGDVCNTKSLLTPVQNALFAFAVNMRNFMYFVGDVGSREVVVVDACWDIDGLLRIAAAQNYTIVAAIVTHYHVDHVGGIPPPPYDKYGVRVDGLAKLLKKLPHISAYIHPLDIPGLIAANPELPVNRLVETRDGYVVTLPVKSAEVKTRFEFLHTPGHTPGSQCVLVNGTRLISGDTLFIGACGRCDFEDSSGEALGESLARLGRDVGDGVVVLPGHDYGGEVTTVEREKRFGVLGEDKRKAYLRKNCTHGGGEGDGR
ncbi:hypothetical protein HDU98_000409 [Podochytrium sp. JEL0797]|nr:hypothetical protein HDU98_000409 [Podochytrium sp. JEL0797]